jgi:hypothetical protein
MKFRSRETVDALQFEYSEDGISRLEEFCQGRVIRHGKKHLPTEGPWCYIIIDSSKQPFVLLESEWFVKSPNLYMIISDKEFKERYEEI